MDRISELREQLSDARFYCRAALLNAFAVLFNTTQVIDYPGGTLFPCFMLLNAGVCGCAIGKGLSARSTALTTISTHLSARRTGHPTTAQDAAAWLKLQKQRSRSLQHGAKVIAIRQPADDGQLIQRKDNDALWGDVVHERL